MEKKIFYPIMSLSAIILLVVLTGCQPQPKPEEVVLKAVQPWQSENVGLAEIDASIANFADQAVFKMVGMPPDVPDTFEGKAAIRAAWESWLPLHPRLQVEVLKVEGDTVTAKTLYWSDSMRALDVAPLEGVDVYIVKDGKIQSETWTLTEASQASLQKAMAAAQTQPTTTPFPPEPTVLTTSTSALSPEVMAESLADLVGTWKGRWSDITSIYLEFKDSGRYGVSYSNGTEINSGYLSFESGRITFKSGQGTDIEPDCKQNFTATYEVYITRRGSQPYQLRFVLVGQDYCDNRKDFMDGKTMAWMEPK